MKAIVIFILSIFSLHQDSSAQTVFAPQGAVWNYYRDGEPPVYNNKFMVEKDTFYEGHYCAKVIGVKTYLSGTKEILKSNYFYTSGDTVLYYHDSLRAFTPLYIFNVKVGDTVTFAAPIQYYVSTKTYKFLITKIDTSIIDGIPLRNVHTNCIYPYGTWLDKYTERIGGFRIGIITSYTGYTIADRSFHLRCYHDNNIDEKFISDAWDCDHVPTGIDEKLNENNIQIFPNPTVNKITVILPENAKIGQVKIVGIDGRMLIQQGYKTSSFEMDLSSLSNGIYFLQVHNSDLHISKVISVVH